MQKAPLIEEVCAILELSQAKFVAAHDDAVRAVGFRARIRLIGGGGDRGFAEAETRCLLQRCFADVLLDHEVRILFHRHPFC